MYQTAHISFSVTPIYLSLAGILFITLSILVIMARQSVGASLGDGGDKQLMRRIRAHGNFAEYAPLTLLMLAAAELQGTPWYALHILGLLFIAGRCLHAYVLMLEEEPIKYRQLAMVATFGVIGALCISLFVNAIF